VYCATLRHRCTTSPWFYSERFARWSSDSGGWMRRRSLGDSAFSDVRSILFFNRKPQRQQREEGVGTEVDFGGGWEGATQGTEVLASVLRCGTRRVRAGFHLNTEAPMTQSSEGWRPASSQPQTNVQTTSPETIDPVLSSVGGYSTPPYLTRLMPSPHQTWPQRGQRAAE
jgi:hypothetical protein